MAFLKLIRPINLMIIVLTMYGTVFYLERIDLYDGFPYNQLDFWMLVLSTVMIAAAGNIINDYFDVKADRINKPEKLIITKHIKRRWAIVSHWMLNGIAFLIGIILSVKYGTFSFVFIHLISINLLWFYSMHFKKKAFVGNLIIAFLTSLIPILTLTFMYFSPGEHNDSSMGETTFKGILDADFIVVHIVAFFAFFQNLAREIVKDVQDVEGDKVIHARTLPMVIGTRRALMIVSLILLILPVFMFLSFWNDSEFQIQPHFENLYFFIVAALINLIVILLIILKIKKLKILDGMIKISMLFGVLSLYQLALL